MRSRQSGRNTPDLHSVERDSDQREQEDRGQNVQQSSEATPERTSDGGQDGGDADDPVQSGRSRGKPWCSGYTRVCIDHH